MQDGVVPIICRVLQRCDHLQRIAAYLLLADCTSLLTTKVRRQDVSARLVERRSYCACRRVVAGRLAVC